MARRTPLKRRKLVTEATRWNVYDDGGVLVGMIELHPSTDVANRFMARMCSHPGAATLSSDNQAWYRTHYGAARSIRARAVKLWKVP
jgi:hypothetical protein